MPVKTVVLQEGVSQELAQVRKQTLSDISYDLNFDIPQKKDALIPATERITFHWQENPNPLSLDFKENSDHLQRMRVNDQETPIVFEKEHIQIAPEFLKKGKNTVYIEFTAGDLSLNRNDEYVHTLFVPDRTRTVFPCFDQPDLKATFVLSLTVPEGWMAVSNATLRDSVISRNQKTYNFKPTDPLPTYLFSFVAGEFDPVTRTLGGREMTLYHRETDTSKIRLSLDPIFETHKDALGFMEEYTQIKYPFQKFDFAAIPDFQYGGMEHAGAIQYKSSSLFLDKGATRSQKMSRIKLLAHETAHMWFGDLVTMRWFNDVWMKEVFANFMADKIAKVAQPLSNYELEFLISHFPTAYGVDRTEGPNAIGQPLDNLNQAGTMYGPIIYHKAPIMMRQLERLMGADALRDGLREYLKKYAYGNATWPDLIAILDKYTPSDLNAWNKVWVNETGRPRFDYGVDVSAGKLTNLTIMQQSEDEFDRIWPQFFEIALIYRNRVEELTVNMNADTVLVPEVVGREAPLNILFNSSGQGYGLFPVNRTLVTQLPEMIPDGLMRTSAYISLYENMLNKEPGFLPTIILDLNVKMLDKETEELSLDLIAEQLSTIFWQFMKPTERADWSDYLEERVWGAMSRVEDDNKKKIIFKLYQNTALSPQAKDRLYEIWRKQEAPTGVTLTEDDYTSLALALAVRDCNTSAISSKEILEQQLTRIKNPDRKKRLQFMLPALSADVAERDNFFNSLKEGKNREHESWVAAALGYLHHPLRAETSQKYLRPSLDLLEEIQKTGDIFFPSAWLSATLGSYQSIEAERVVRAFLQENPSYNPRLKAKLLQAADNLFRAERIVN